ncbi:MAG: hypothetical protein HY319_15875 [Armatimonadetes bacterium]|nr:hypothetical protein [Armatimonadota bacterium]
MGKTSTFHHLDSARQQRLLDKLSRLEALSGCPTGNVNETAAAAAAMTRVMLEYQIEKVDLDAPLSAADENPEVVDELVYPVASHNGFPVWKTQILSALADVNHCISYTSSWPVYFLWTRRTSSHLRLIGTHQDIDNARRLFFFCVQEVERLAKEWGTGETVKRRNDFKRGAAAGIADRVIEERDLVLREERDRDRDRSSAALELFDRKNRAARAFAAERGVYFRPERPQRVYHDAYDAGYRVGGNLDLSRGSRAALPETGTARA